MAQHFITIYEYPKCKECGSSELIYLTEYLKKQHELPQEGQIYPSQNMEMSALQQASTIVLTVPMLVYHYDHCRKCGTRRVVKVQSTDAPVMAQQGNPNQRPPFQKPHL